MLSSIPSGLFIDNFVFVNELGRFETSEMLARFLGSTPLLPESWKLCARSNVMAPQGFLTDEVGGVTYVAFSGVQSVDGLDPFCGNLVPLLAASGVSPFSGGGDGGMFSAFQKQEHENTVMVDAGLLNLFLDIYRTPVFQNQVCFLFIFRSLISNSGDRHITNVLTL